MFESEKHQELPFCIQTRPLGSKLILYRELSFFVGFKRLGNDLQVPDISQTLYYQPNKLFSINARVFK